MASNYTPLTRKKPTHSSQSQRSPRLTLKPEEDVENFIAYGKNSPTSAALRTISNHQKTNSPKVFNFSESPKSSIVSNDPTAKIKCPSKYVFSTHNHCQIFAAAKTISIPRTGITPQSPNQAVLRPLSTPKATPTAPRQLEAPKSSTPRNSSLNGVVTRVRRGELRGDAAHQDHLIQTYNALRFVKNLREVDLFELDKKRVILPRRKGYENKKTVVFDLDETLVHCSDDPTRAHVTIQITFPTGETVNAGVNVRPFARDCLISANRDFEVIVFTASHKCYADRVLDYIDPTGQLIHHRLYRDNCVIVDGVFMKDLRILTDRNLEDVIIVDNAAYSFGYQLDNGIPIISWYDDMTDRELFKLMDYLKVLSKLPDIREVNKKTFNLERFYENFMRNLQRDSENIPPEDSL